MTELAALVARVLEASEVPSEDRSRAWHYCAAPEVSRFFSDEKTGKWCIFPGAAEVDEAWRKVEQLARAGQILCAKVSTAAARGRHTAHVICVYTQDWSNTEDLLKTRQVLRTAGFTRELGYKRDVDTANGVYGADEWFLRV